MSAAIVADLREIILHRFKTASLKELLDISDDVILPSTGRGCSGPDWQILNEDEALDRNTGLIWYRNYVPGGAMKWKAAMDAASGLIIRGKQMRPPTIREQLSIVEYDRRNPAFNADVLRGGSDVVWTSTKLKSNDASSPSGYAWLVGFDYGLSYCFLQYCECFVRAVRSSPGSISAAADAATTTTESTA